MLSKTLALAGLASMASAHMMISQPVPYGKSNLNNSPLDKSGSDFPCKQRDGVYDAQGASNVFAQGSTQQLAFLGSAVHGGGSCQISVTADLKPTKNSVWKVIKSIEGGCPAKGQEGNLPANPGNSGGDKYDYTIPKELAAGNYTLAWTWFNKVGNREMYMNCAPLTVTGSAGSQSFMNGLPDMFVANIGNCETKEGTDVAFPNPGEDVDKFGTQTADALQPPPTQCAAGNGGGNNGGSPAGPTSAAAQPTEQPQQTSAPASQPTQAPVNSIPGGVFITKSRPAQNEPAPTQPAATNEVPVPAPTNVNGSEPAAPTGDGSSPAPSAGTGGNGGNGGSGGAGGYAQGTPCTTEGEWNCISGTSFQRCASGMWSATQGVALGTQCSAGQSSELKMVSAKAARRNLRRAMRFAA